MSDSFGLHATAVEEIRESCSQVPRVGVTMTPVNELTNSKCPDYHSHRQNAEERLGFREGQVVTREEDEAIIAETEAEYRACEGH
jgi:hypothetical protein